MVDKPGDAAPKTPAPPEPAKPAVANDNESDAKPDEPADEPAAAKPEPDTKTEAKTDDAPDEDTKRALDKIRRDEKRAKESVATERADWKRERDREEARLAPKLAELEKFEAMKARAKYDPTGVLEALGLSDEDWEPTSKAAWARTKAAKADPKNRVAVEQTAREREQADRLVALEKRLAERDKLDAERETQTRNAKLVGDYIDGVTKVVDDATPLLRSYLAKNPEAARRALHQMAVDITDPDDPMTPPTPAAVAKAYEERRAKELDELGIDYKQLLKPAVAATKPSKTLGSGGGATVPKKQTRDPKEIDDEIRRALMEDKLE